MPKSKPAPGLEPRFQSEAAKRFQEACRSAAVAAYGDSLIYGVVGAVELVDGVPKRVDVLEPGLILDEVVR